MDNSQSEIAKLIENNKFSIPFSNKTDHMDYPTMRKALEEQGYFGSLNGAVGKNFIQLNEIINPYQFEIVQNKDNFFTKGGTHKWHKNIVIPQTQVKLLENQSNSNCKNQNCTFEVEMKCWAKKENGQYQEILLDNNQGHKKIGNSNSIITNNSIKGQVTCVKGVNTLQNLDKVAKFSSLKFSSTGYLESEIAKSPSGQNNQNPENIIKFRIYIYIYKITDQNARQLYDIYFSHPITVSARKKSRQSRASFSVLMETFLPKYLEIAGNEGEQGIVELKDFLSKASERHKIFHPLYLFGRFPSALNIYYKTNIKKQKAEKLAKDQIISFQETLIEAYMKQEEQVVILHFLTEGLEKDQIRKLEQYLKPLKNKQIKLCFHEQEMYRLNNGSYSCLQKEGFVENYKKVYYELTKVLLNTRNRLHTFDSSFVLKQESNISKYEEIQKKCIKQVFEFNHSSQMISEAIKVKVRINDEYSHHEYAQTTRNPKQNADFNILSQSASPSIKKVDQNIYKTCTKNDNINNKSQISIDSNLANIETEEYIRFEKKEKAHSPVKQTQQIPCFYIFENKSELQESISNQISNPQTYQQVDRNAYTQQQYHQQQQQQQQEVNLINQIPFNQNNFNPQNQQQQKSSILNDYIINKFQGYQPQNPNNQEQIVDSINNSQQIFQNIDPQSILQFLYSNQNINTITNLICQQLQQQQQQQQQDQQQKQLLQLLQYQIQPQQYQNQYQFINLLKQLN